MDASAGSAWRRHRSVGAAEAGSDTTAESMGSTAGVHASVAAIGSENGAHARHASALMFQQSGQTALSQPPQTRMVEARVANRSRCAPHCSQYMDELSVLLFMAPWS
jgi:hypothetical protein